LSTFLSGHDASVPGLITCRRATSSDFDTFNIRSLKAIIQLLKTLP
jgi:hypothetical protein